MGCAQIHIRTVIRLGQFLQLAGVAESGSHARELITDGYVLVDSEVENRRGRQLRGGEIVEVAGESFEVVLGES